MAENKLESANILDFEKIAKIKRLNDNKIVDIWMKVNV